MAFQCSSGLCSIANISLYVVAIVVLFAFCVAALVNEPDKRTWKTCNLVKMSVLSAFTLPFFAFICGEVYYTVSSILFNLWNTGISGDSAVRRWTLRLWVLFCSDDRADRANDCQIFDFPMCCWCWRHCAACPLVS